MVRDNIGDMYPDMAEMIPQPEAVIANTLDPILFGRYFFPAGVPEGLSDSQLVDIVAETRHKAVLPHLGKVALTGHEALLVEATGCLLTGGPGMALPISAERQQQIITGTHAQANMMAEAIRQEAVDIQLDHLMRMESGANPRPLPDDFILLCKIFSAVSHATVQRRNKREYFTHTEDSASIIRIAMQKVALKRSNHLYVPTQSAPYIHDTIEENLKKDGSHIYDTIISTPLVVTKLMDIAEYPQPRQPAFSRSLMSLTRVENFAEETEAYLDYVEHGCAQSGEAGLLFVITKAADITHNYRIERELDSDDPAIQSKIEKRRARYQAAEQILRRHAAGYGPKILELVDAIFAVTAEEVRAESATNDDMFIVQTVSRSVKHKLALLAA